MSSLWSSFFSSNSFILSLLLLLSLHYTTVNSTANTTSSVLKRDELVHILQRAESHGIINNTQVQLILNLTSTSTTLWNDSTRISSPSQERSIFMTMYNQLTLLNVLYFAGSLLIIGAYSLLMNIAWEHFSSTGISVLMTGQTLLVGTAGLLLWTNTDNYQFLGGLLCTISTSMVPYTVYWIQKALQIWPKGDPGVFQGFRLYIRPGWVAMEIAAVIIGSLYLTIVRFPFLLAPVSFCLWFLSMDVTPLLPQWANRDSHSLYELRRSVSIIFGLSLMIAGRCMEYILGSEPDFGFWLYLFGLISFWFSITLQEPTNDPLKKSFYFLINITLVLIGSHLDRNTFHLFGTVGVVLISVSTYFHRQGLVDMSRGQRSLLLWLLKALGAISLLSQAMKHEGSIEIINSIICFIAFNIEGLLYIPLGEHYQLFILLTNLGFVAAVPSFDHTLSLWFVELEFLPQILSLFTLSLLLFHLNLFKYLNQETLRLKSALYLTYRVLISVGVSFVLVFLRQSWYVWVGGVGVIIIAMILQVKRGRIGLKERMGQFILLLASICLSIYFHSNMYYFVSCTCMGVAILSMLNRYDWEMGLGTVLSIQLILFSIPLQSKFMIAIGGIYIFGYLSHLAYVVFRRSFLFPFALIGLGFLLIYIGVMYQSYQDVLYELSLSILPKDLSTFSEFSIDLYPYFRDGEFSLSSLISASYLWLLYPGMLIHSLARESLPYSTIGCVVGMCLVAIAMVISRVIDRYCPDMTSSVKVNSMRLSLGDPDGIIIKVNGVKPSQLELPKYISLNIHGEEFWSSLGNVFNGFAITIVRSAFLPYQLTPHSITCTGFNKGSTKFTATVKLVTGEGGRPGVGKQTIIDNARKIQSNLATMNCVLLYSNAVYLPYSPLCEYDLAVNSACDMLLRESNNE